TRTAALRQQRPPVPWRQPTFIVHEAELKPCADALGQLLQQPGSAWAAEKPWVTALPASLKAQPRTIELWLPAPQPVLRQPSKE
ncbi:MAG: hypothetical protein JSR14_00205, partial [Proteobacteria bacterium]|nr:hypothetical protein [Pseudomonadota bacterium]